jgi:hypothetical protein
VAAGCIPQAVDNNVTAAIPRNALIGGTLRFNDWGLAWLRRPWGLADPCTSGATVRLGCSNSAKQPLVEVYETLADLRPAGHAFDKPTPDLSDHGRNNLRVGGRVPPLTDVGRAWCH